MNTIRVFQRLREELSHTYLKAKLMTLVGADPEVSLLVLENPKNWYQLKLRIDLLFRLAESVLGIKAGERLAECRRMIGSTRNKLDAAIIELRCTKGDTNEVRVLLRELEDRLHALKRLDYDLKPPPRFPDDGSPLPSYEMLTANFRSLSEIATLALLNEENLLETLHVLSKRYWSERSVLEFNLIAFVVAAKPAELNLGLRPFLTPLKILDRTVEEVLSPNFSIEERISRTLIASNKHGFSSLEEQFVETEINIITLLKGLRL